MSPLLLAFWLQTVPAVFTRKPLKDMLVGVIEERVGDLKKEPDSKHPDKLKVTIAVDDAAFATFRRTHEGGSTSANAGTSLPTLPPTPGSKRPRSSPAEPLPEPESIPVEFGTQPATSPNRGILASLRDQFGM